MAQFERGTAEWFEREKLYLIEHVKAVDSFGAAARGFQKLVDLGPGADDEVSAALHTSSVVTYGRPFSNNKLGSDGVRTTFGKKIVKAHPNFDEGIHQQLLDLRNKLIAHSDSDYSDGRLFRKTLNLHLGPDRVKLLVGAWLVTQTVHRLHDMALAERCLKHVKAVEEAAIAAATKRLEEVVKAGQEFPDAIEAASVAAAAAGGRAPITLGGGPLVQIPSDKTPARLPHPRVSPHAVLNFPPLVIGPDGYVYRAYSLDIDLSGRLSWRKDDGSEGTIDWNMKVSEDDASPSPPPSEDKARDA